MVTKLNLIYFSELIIEECNKQNKDIPFDKDKVITPNTYNKISLLILKELVSLIIEVSNSNKNISINHNIPLIYLTKLQNKISQSFFIKYEFFYFDDLNHTKIHEHPIHSKNNFKKILSDQLLEISNVMNPSYKCVGYLSNTNFSWRELNYLLKKKKIKLFNANDNRKIYIPEFQFQIELIQKKIDKIYENLSNIFKIDFEELNKINFEKILKEDSFITNKKVNNNKKYLPKMIITGTIGNSPKLRAYILDYMSKNIHVSLVHHGAHYMPLDEPNYLLYEGVISDSKIIYGNIEKQKNLGTLGKKENIFGKKINYISRTDSFLSKLNISDKKIDTINQLKNKKIIYFGTEFSAGRYGPYRDLHPTIYSKWQTLLLEWLKKEINGEPIVRLHPKRVTNDYDPKNFVDCKNFNLETIKNADIFVVDYPTTSLANVCSTDKPVIFFDTGMRRLNDEAKVMLKKRCCYNLLDWENLEKSFIDIKLEFQKQCVDNFTETFCNSGDLNSEIAVVSKFISSMVE